MGSFLDPNNNSYGFVRDAAGNFTLIQFRGASVTAGVVGINDRGTIAGNYLDAWTDWVRCVRPCHDVPGQARTI
jgi:hypothetical protein